MEIGREIARQIGNKALAMLGAKGFLAGENSLQFDIRGSTRVSKIVVVLAADDTYTVSFLKGRGARIKFVAQAQGVYCDSLHAVIEAETGLRVSLGTMGG